MPVTKDKPAPYAPASAILGLIERHRARGLPSPVDAEVLARAGVADSLNPRTLQALQTLDLINEEGRHKDVFEGLRLAPEGEYKQRLAEWLNNAYADVLTFVDPAKDDDTKLRDAFRPYTPTGQQARMVSLFNGLYEATGVREKTGQTNRDAPRGSVTRIRAVRRTPPPQKNPPPTGAQFTPSSKLPTALAGLLSSLPVEGSGWTQERRNKFVTTFEAVLDFCFPIQQTVESEIEDDPDAEDDALEAGRAKAYGTDDA